MVGFNCANLPTLDKKYLCPTCNLVLRSPLQLGCGHRFCRGCVEDEREVIQCTQCSEPTQKPTAFPDHGMNNDMQKLNIECYDCSWNGSFKDYAIHLDAGHFHSDADSTIARIQCLAAKLKEYVNGVRKLQKSLKKRSAQIFTHALSVEETNPPAEGLQEQEHCFTSYDGFLMWKIDGINRRFNDNQNTVLTSPPFYTSPYGYKMCVHLYPNGGTLRHATHASMFLVIMRGEYDALLAWPFDFQVTFCLYDLAHMKQHIFASFQSNRESPSCQRPQGSAYIGTGLPHFIPLSALRNGSSPYVSEDSILIKVMLTKESLSAAALSKIMSVNPAWPLHLHTEMVTKELEKHRRQHFKLTLTLKSRSS